MEEESNVACFFVGSWIRHFSVGLGKAFTEIFKEFFFILTLQVVFFDFFEIEIIDNESGGHDVILIHDFGESLDSGSFQELFLVNFTLHSLWVSCDTDED